LRTTVLTVATLVGLLTGCGAAGDDVGISKPTGEQRPTVFAPGALVWAERSTIHVGDQTYDVGPRIVTSMDWTPYGLYLELTNDPVEGPFEDVFFDGETMTAEPDVYAGPITSPDGELAAWIDRSGPDRPAGRVAQVVVVDTATGDRIFESSEGMGGEEGDDLGDRYEELPPAVVDLTEDRLVWRNAEGSGSSVTTDLTTGQSTVSTKNPGLRPTSGFEFWSPDGEYRVDASNTGRLRVHPRQPDFGHRWQTQGGWLADHTMLALGQDRYQFSYDPTKPDTTPGYLLSCDLDARTCQQLGKVAGARDVVFPGIDVDY
jgi:hypothetical protein